MGPFSKKPSEPQVNQQDTTRVDPAHETLPSAASQPVVRKEKHSKAFSFVSVLFLLTLLGAGIMTYLWYNQAADVESLNSEISQLKSEQALLKKQGATVTTNEGGFRTQSILGALAESYHLADKTQTFQTNPYVVKIKYLDDKDLTFARVHIEYISSDQSLPKATPTGKFDYYIFKAVTVKNGDKEWVMLAKNPMVEAELNELKNTYGVPSDVLDLKKEIPA